MMKLYKTLCFVIIGLLAGSSGCGPHENMPPTVRLELIAQGFTSPVALIDPDDGNGRMFVVDQTGLIWILSGGELDQTPFLDIRENVVALNSFYEERGLLGLAFHPNFPANNHFYISYSGRLRSGLPTDQWDHTTYISEFAVSASDPDRADSNSERILLALDKPGYNYEAGHIAFGPDGYLYIATGDSVRDPTTQAGQFAQDKTSLLGKILRIDVNGSAASGTKYRIPADNPFVTGDGLPEIFAYGFRNPYRFSFDVSDTGETRLFVADVGQALMEEVSLVEPGGNYGWPIREGTMCFNPMEWNRPLKNCNTTHLAEPIIAYTHEENLSAIIGGGVYRGNAFPELAGSYLFGDWGLGEGRLFAAHPPDVPFGSWKIAEIQIELREDQPRIGQLLGIGQDQHRELYLLTKAPGLGVTGNSGAVYRLIPVGP